MKKVYASRFLLKLLSLAAILYFGLSVSYAQPGLPQRTVTVQPTQAIDFGLFYAVSAGTITVDWQGNISTTGGVVSLSDATVHPAIFDIKLCEGRNVTITYDPTTTLTNGEQSLTLNIGPTERGMSGATFPVNSDCNFITTIRVGGTLEIPGGPLTGSYNGSFSMTFTQE